MALSSRIAKMFKYASDSVAQSNSVDELFSPALKTPVGMKPKNRYEFDKMKFKFTIVQKLEKYLETKTQELKKNEYNPTKWKNKKALNVYSKQYFSEKIKTELDWILLSFSPGDFHYTAMRACKIIIDREDKDRCYFINSYYNNFHYMFYKFYIYPIIKEKEEKKTKKKVEEHKLMTLEVFNNTQYKELERRFVLFSLNEYVEQKKFCLELWPDDTLTEKQVRYYFGVVAKQVYFRDMLYFRPISNIHLSNCPEPGSDFRVATKLFSGRKYQGLTTGTCIGMLKFFSLKDGEFNFSEKHIVVCESIPLDITLVSGIITNCLQTPLCHIALLSSCRKTPNMALIDCFKLDKLRKLENKYVKLTVKNETYEISISSEKDYLQWKLKKDIEKGEKTDIILKTPSEFNELIYFTKDYEIDLKNVIGEKAYSLHKIMKFKNKFPGKVKVVDGMVMPFATFLSYISQFKKKEDDVPEIEMMKKKPFKDKSVINKIMKWLKTQKCDKAIFRSSTNVEDIAGFNGAGLYESLSVDVSKQEGLFERISKTITDVFISLFTKKAVIERQFYNIMETNIAMAILIMPFIKLAEVNGVVLSCNPFGKNYPSYFGNYQKGKLVTDSKCEIPEQWISHYMGPTDPSHELVSKSSLCEEILLSDENLNSIFNAVQILDHEFWPTFQTYCDIELVVSKGFIYILQCRPYTGQVGKTLG